MGGSPLANPVAQKSQPSSCFEEFAESFSLIELLIERKGHIRKLSKFLVSCKARNQKCTNSIPIEKALFESRLARAKDPSFLHQTKCSIGDRFCLDCNKISFDA